MWTINIVSARLETRGFACSEENQSEKFLCTNILVKWHEKIGRNILKEYPAFHWIPLTSLHNLFLYYYYCIEDYYFKTIRHA